MICQSCNGVIGRDCFNPEECMAITRDKSDRYDSLEVELRDAMHRIEQLEAVLADLLTDEPCSLDHHGFCQTHYCHPPCPHERAKKLLSKYPYGKLTERKTNGTSTTWKTDRR